MTWWVNIAPHAYLSRTLIGFAPFGVWSPNYEDFTKTASGFPSQIFSDNGLRQYSSKGFLDFYQDAGACSKGTLSTTQFTEENSASDALFVVNGNEWNWEYEQMRAEDYLGGSNPLFGAKFFHTDFAVSAGALKRALGVSRVSFSRTPWREPTEDEPHLYGKTLDYIEAQGDSNEANSSNRLSAKLWEALGLRLGEYATDTSNGAVSGFVACVDVNQYEKITLNTATVNAEDYNNWNVATGRYDGRNQRVYVHRSQPVYSPQEVSVVTVETRDNGYDSNKFDLYAQNINFGAYGIEAKILVKGETSEGWERLTDEAQFERMYQGYQIPILTAVLAQNNSFGEETTHIEWYIADKSKSQFSAIGAGGVVQVTLDQIISALGLLQLTDQVDKIVEFFKNGITLTFIINPWDEGSQPPRPISRFMLGNRIEGSEPINDWRNL
jgi:hypothetical protein